MTVKVTAKDPDGHSHTLTFRPWYAIGTSFRHGDKIKLLFIPLRIVDGIFDHADNEYIYLLAAPGNPPESYPLKSIVGFENPRLDVSE